MKQIIKTSSGKYISKYDYSKNLIAKWFFDDTYSENNIGAIDGTKIRDLSGHGNDLNSYNLEFKDDKILGRCAYFNGINSYCIADTSVIPVYDFSVKIKFKPELPNMQQNGNKEAIVLINNDNNRDSGLEIWLNADKGVYSEIRCNVVQSNYNPINFNEQLDYLITFDEQNKRYLTYINKLDYAIDSKYINKNQSAPCNNLMIGKLLKFDYYFKGYIKSIEIYDTPLVFTKYKKFLLQQSNRLYTIKSEFYEPLKSQYKPITEIDIDNITDEDLKKYGLDDIGDIVKTIDEENLTMTQVGKLESGIQFSTSLNNSIKRIDDIYFGE